MHKTLIGHTGFVGSNLLAQTSFEACFNSKNIANSVGLETDLLVVSGAPAVKWWANQNGQADLENIQRLIASLRGISAKKVVLISTIDVYETTQGRNEHDTPAPIQPYGLNRSILEHAVAKQFADHAVVRLPGLFGPGLKKNIIFDLMNDNMVGAINRASAFQWYDLTRLWADIDIALNEKLPVVNLFPAPLETESLVAHLFPQDLHRTASDEVSRVSYDNHSAHAALFGGQDGYIQSQGQVLDGLRAYVEAAR